MSATIKGSVKVFLTQQKTFERAKEGSDELHCHNTSENVSAIMEDVTIMEDLTEKTLSIELDSVLLTCLSILIDGPKKEHLEKGDGFSGTQLCCRSLLLGQGVNHWVEGSKRKNHQHYPIYRLDDASSEERYFVRVHRK